MKTIKVEVRQNNINAGHRWDAQHCPIARAMKQKTGKHCVASKDGIEFSDGTRYSMSDRGRRFISKFDRQGKKAVKPQTFIFRKIS